MVIEELKKLDKFTLEYIGQRISDLEVKNFNEYQNKIEYARGRDDAYRNCARIISSLVEDTKILKRIERQRRKKKNYKSDCNNHSYN